MFPESKLKKEQIIIFLFKRRPCRERILVCTMNISLYAITHPCYLFRVKKDSFLFLCRFLSLSFLQQLLAVSPISGTQKRAFFFFSFLRWDNSSFSQLWAEERRLRSRRKGEKKRAPLFTNDRKKNIANVSGKFGYVFIMKKVGKSFVPSFPPGAFIYLFD